MAGTVRRDAVRQVGVAGRMSRGGGVAPAPRIEHGLASGSPSSTAVFRIVLSGPYAWALVASPTSYLVEPRADVAPGDVAQPAVSERGHDMEIEQAPIEDPRPGLEGAVFEPAVGVLKERDRHQRRLPPPGCDPRPGRDEPPFVEQLPLA